MTNKQTCLYHCKLEFRDYFIRTNKQKKQNRQKQQQKI